MFLNLVQMANTKSCHFVSGLKKKNTYLNTILTQYISFNYLKNTHITLLSFYLFHFCECVQILSPKSCDKKFIAKVSLNNRISTDRISPSRSNNNNTISTEIFRADKILII